MTRYKNTSGSSGVRAYETGVNSIRVQFADGSIYLYNIASAGHYNILQMQRLAVAGKGLSTFISRHVKERYATRLK